MERCYYLGLLSQSGMRERMLQVYCGTTRKIVKKRHTIKRHQVVDLPPESPIEPVHAKRG